MNKSNTAVMCFSDGGGGMDMDAIKLALKLAPYSKTTLVAKKGTFIEKRKSQYLNTVSLCTVNSNSKLSLNFILKIRSVLSQNNIKNVIFFGTSEILPLRFSFLNKDINFIISHGTTKSTPKQDFFHRFLYKNVNHHVSISKHLYKNVEKIFPFGPHTKSDLIYTPVITRELPYIKPKKVTLLHISRIVSGKGQTDAISACEILEKNKIDFEFKIVGEIASDYSEEFMNFYNSCKYKNKIKLLGRFDNIFQFFETADIFLFPSYGEGLSNSFIEALSTNINIICYNNTVFPEFQNMGFKFDMVDNLNVEKLKKKLLYVAQNLSKTRSQYNSNLTRKIFSPQVEVDKYLAILK